MATHKILKASNVRSLVWSGDELVDWVAGGARYGLDGSIQRSAVNYAYRFDAAVASTDGVFAVIYEQKGTKGLVLRNGEVLREINRSYYHADDYAYPVCLWTDSHGRTLMAHCPEEYNRIEIDDAETGERLTESSERTPVDIFHSRLQANPGGTRLFSAGWVWQPWDVVQFFDITQALQDPKCLDVTSGLDPSTDHAGVVQECGACWQTDDHVIVAGDKDEFPDEERDNLDVPSLRHSGLAVYDIPSRSVIRCAVPQHPAGMMMPVGEDHVVAFDGHPRLVSLEDGAIQEEWPEILSGHQASSILRGGDPPPAIAMDSRNRRFAVVSGEGIHVVTL